MPDGIRRSRRKRLAMRMALLFLFLGSVWALLTWAVAPLQPISPLISDIGFIILPAILAYLVIDRLVKDIQEKNHYFHQLTDNIREVFWVGAVDWSKMLYISPAYEAIWGRSRISLYANPRSWLDAVHPQDVGQVLEDIPKSPQDIGDVVEFAPYRIVKPDGEIRWIKARAFPVYDEQGQILRMVGIAEDITRLMDADRALKQSELLHRTILNNAPVLVSIKNLEGTVTFVNRQFDVLEGPSPGDYVGKNIYELFPRAIADALWENDLEAQHSTLPVVSEEQVRHRDGTLHTYLTYKFALHDEQGVVDSTCAVSMDITERKRMEQALQQEKERAQSYLDLAGVMLVAIEADQTVSLINKKGCELLGYHEEEIIGKNWFDHFIPVMSREQVRQGFAQLIAGNVKEIENFENPVLTRSGQERLIAWHNTVFGDDSGHIVRTFSSGTDITEQRQFENEAAQLMRQLQQSQKMEAIGHLTGGIAHDFNNILTSIMGYTELSRIEAGKIENTRIQNYLNNVTVSSERARDLVAQLLSFSRGVATELKPVEIGKQIQEFLSMLRATFPTTIDLRTEFTCPDVTVNADLVQLNQVLMNLSINARDAMNGHGEIVYGLDQCSGIDAECSSCHQLFAGDYVELSVTDTGDGIDESILSHIFDPFFTTKEVGKGTGMGLAMVHGIVHAHGGHVLVESVVDGGTRFRLFFPSAHQDMKQHLVQEKAGHYHADNITRNLQGHVLLVDDEDMIISYITELLQSCGLDVTTINNSLYALDTFSHDPEQFDMIITDQTMPTMTGVELVARIREIRRDIPVVLMTGHSDEIDQDKVAALNINGFMHKPLEQKSFLLTVAQLLDH